MSVFEKLSAKQLQDLSRLINQSRDAGLKDWFIENLCEEDSQKLSLNYFESLVK